MLEGLVPVALQFLTYCLNPLSFHFSLKSTTPSPLPSNFRNPLGNPISHRRGLLARSHSLPSPQIPVSEGDTVRSMMGDTHQSGSQQVFLPKWCKNTMAVMVGGPPSQFARTGSPSRPCMFEGHQANISLSLLDLSSKLSAMNSSQLLIVLLFYSVRISMALSSTSVSGLLDRCRCCPC